jgi:hypothetical protein
VTPRFSDFNHQEAKERSFSARAARAENASLPFVASFLRGENLP